MNVNVPTVSDDVKLQELFEQDYNNAGRLIAKFILLDEDEETPSNELVTADVYFNGNEFSIDAYTWIRKNRPRSEHIRIVKDPTLEDGRWLSVQVEFDMEDMKSHGSVPLSETVYKTLIYHTKKLLEMK